MKITTIGRGNIGGGDEGARDAVEQLSRDIGMKAVYGGAARACGDSRGTR